MNHALDATSCEKFKPNCDGMPQMVTQFQADHDAIRRTYSLPFSQSRRSRLKTFYEQWNDLLAKLPYSEISRNDQLDWVLLKLLLESENLRLEHLESRYSAAAPLIPFAAALIELDDNHRSLLDIAPRQAAAQLDAALSALRGVRSDVEKGRLVRSATAANYAAACLDTLGEALSSWFDFYNGYNPEFAWWVRAPYESLRSALIDYAEYLRHSVAQVDVSLAIQDSIGRQALLDELRFAQVPYTPEELIERAQAEMEWCTREMQRAAKEMGFGDDWRAAMEQVKSDHSAPGEQTRLVRDLAYEAIEFLDDNDLLTVPPIARECWRMEMMPPERQKVNSFFLGGEELIVSYPSSDMEHAQKMMSLRGNNKHFSRATVQHELIPGHRLQNYFEERYHPYRTIFQTPFWIEGWTLHWEMLLWELGFARKPQERMGMLFWRKHRCARVVFSLSYHLGAMSPEQCVDMLTDEVLHERDHAVTEVRRSFTGEYHPLYQCAYLIGGHQVHSLYHEIVDGGKMTPREFHDAFLQQNCMPIGIVRALLLNLPLESAASAKWYFWEEPAKQAETLVTS